MTAAALLAAAFSAANAGDALPAPAAARSTRADATAAESRADYPAALGLYLECAASAPDGDAAYCRRRAAVLEPQAADGFAGWSVLADVRREFATLAPAAAEARVADALARAPAGPAAPELRTWLRESALARQDWARAEEWATDDDARARVAAARAAARSAAAERRGAEVGAAMGAAYLLVAARGRGAIRWRSAGAAALFLAAPAIAIGAIDEPRNLVGFARCGAVTTLAVLVSERAPWWLGAAGTFGGLVAVAWWNGWHVLPVAA